MRHFAGILLGIVLVPVFFALNWAVNYADGQVGPDGGGWWLLALLAVYAVIGVVAAIFLASRSISPMALLIGGLLIAAAEVLLFLPRLVGLEVNIPRLYDFPQITGGYLLVAVGAALLFGGFFPTRWHRKRSKDDEEAERTLMPAAAGDDELHRDQDYDASWGSGRNEYAEEPEEPYGSRVGGPGEYDQQALGYSPRDTGGSRYEDAPTSQYDRYEDAPTSQYEQPPTIHDPYESQPTRAGYDDLRR